jgi:lipopolysaccharide transport protein LptA
MASSHRNRRVATWLLVWVTALSGVDAVAQAPCANPKIVLDAEEPFDFDYQNNTAIFRDVVITQCDTRIEGKEANVKGGLNFENGELTVSGNVRIQAEGGNLSSDKAVVLFHDNLISRATITGTPAAFEQVRADGSTSRGHAGTMTYDTSTGTVSLRQDAWLSVGCYEAKAQELVYNIRAQRMQNQTQAGTAGGGRIVFTIQPKGESGNPCAKPGAETKP